MIASHGFKQLIKDPKRVTSDLISLIDVLLSNKPSMISKALVVPLSISDLDCIACVRKVSNAKIPAITRNMTWTSLQFIFFLMIGNRIVHFYRCE